MPTDPLLDVADALYALPLAEFTSARDAQARELKGADRELAARVTALRKPTVAAWVVNLLVRREAGQVDQVLSVGAALREAQENPGRRGAAGADPQRRQLTAAVTTRARALAAEAGHRATEAVAEQVEATLTAAMVDAGAADAVRSGLLVTALASTGVDAVDVDRGRGRCPRRSGSAPPHGWRRHRHDPTCRSSRTPRTDRRPACGRGGPGRSRAPRRRGRRGAPSWPWPGSPELQAASLQVQAELDELRRRVAELEVRAEGTDDELVEAEAARADAADAEAVAVRVRDAARAALEG